MPYPTYITGTITLSDGSTSSFSIMPDLGWQQWGNDPSKLGATVDLMEALAETAGDHLRADDNEVDE